MRPDDTRILESAGLSGRDSLALDAAGEGTALLVEVSSAEMIDVWRQARTVIDSTRRWPVLVTSWGADEKWAPAFEHEDLFSRWPYGEDQGKTDCEPSNILHRAAQVDIQRFFDEYPDWGGSHWEENIGENIEWTKSLCGAAPDLDDVRRAVATDPAPLAVERFLLRWEIGQGCKVPLEYQDWFTPPGPIALALLPVAEPWAVYAFIHTLYDADHAVLVRAAQLWHERYGAEPVALWGTMTQLLLNRRPTDVEEALQLAVEHDRLGTSTLGPPGIRLRWHARALMVLDRWFLHNRP